MPPSFDGEEQSLLDHTVGYRGAKVKLLEKRLRASDLARAQPGADASGPRIAKAGRNPGKVLAKFATLANICQNSRLSTSNCGTFCRIFLKT